MSARDRYLRMLETGATMREVGAAYGVSHQAVQQLTTGYEKALARWRSPAWRNANRERARRARGVTTAKPQICSLCHGAEGDRHNRRTCPRRTA